MDVYTAGEWYGKIRAREKRGESAAGAEGEVDEPCLQPVEGVELGE